MQSYEVAHSSVGRASQRYRGGHGFDPVILTVLRSLLLLLVHPTGLLRGALCPFFDIDRQVIDLNWKILINGALYTGGAPFLLWFIYPCCLAVHAAPLDTLSHLFFACPLAQSVLPWLQLLMFSFSPMSPRVLLLRHSDFVVLILLNYGLLLVSLYIV